MRSCLRQDSAGPDLSFLKGSYLQPELKADRHVWPDSLSEMEKEALEQSDNHLEQTNENVGETPKDEVDRKGKTIEPNTPGEEMGQSSSEAKPEEEVGNSGSESKEPGNGPEEEEAQTSFFGSIVDSLKFR